MILNVFILLKEYVLITCLMFTVMRAATLDFVILTMINKVSLSLILALHVYIFTFYF